MIVSHKLKFIFIKGQKVAGTSVEMALSPFCGPIDIVTPITPADEFKRLAMGGACQNYCNDFRLEAEYLKLVAKREFSESLDTSVHSPTVSKFYNHMSLSKVEACIKIPFESYRLVIAERNPYAKVISLANMQLSFSSYRGEGMENAPDAIKAQIEKLFDSGKFQMVRNIDLYRTGKPYLETVALHQENLASDLERLLIKLKVDPSRCELPHAKKGVGNRGLDPAEMFTRQQLDIVNKEFAEEFERFGYERI